jgi:pre-mRNA-splicing factor CWC26
VQVEEQARRVMEHVHEMNKPLARYADDKDLESLLRSQEREGDPMLEYLREKKQQENPGG